MHTPSAPSGRSRTLPRMAMWLAMALLLALAAGCNRQQPDAQKNRFTVAVIPQGSTHEFWKSIHAGAMKAKQELGAEGVEVEIIWKGPLREDDREQQVQVVEGFISQQVSGMVLAPYDSHALVRPVEEAAAARIPTVIVDSALDTQNIVSFVATDNRKGGELAAQTLSQLLNGKGKVLLLRYAEGVSSTLQREEGFVQGLKASPGIELISSNQYAGPTRETARRAAENLLTRHGGEIHAVFTPNESSTAGMMLALQDANLSGKVKHVGFDASQTFVDAMRQGRLQGIVLQNPFAMGELGVRTLVTHLRGQPVQKRIDTGVIMVTPSNLDSEAAQHALNPPLQKYLGR